MKKLYKIAVLLLVVIVYIKPAFSFENKIVYISGKNCNHGIKKLTNSPYSLLTFCEGALGSYLAIIYSDKMLAPADGAWGLNDRYWQHDLWGQDVTSYYFDSQKALLYVATSEIYGEGGIYRLDLRNKKFETMITIVEKEGRIYQLESIDHEKRLLRYIVIMDGKTQKNRHSR